MHAQSNWTKLAFEQTLRLSSVHMQQQVSAESAMSSPCSCLSTISAPSRSSLSMASYRGLRARTALSLRVVKATDQDAAAVFSKASGCGAWTPAATVWLLPLAGR